MCDCCSNKGEEPVILKNYRFLECSAECTKEQRYDIAYMNMAIAVSRLSYAERAHVGCILVSPSGQVISHGWNGTPSGMPNTCEYFDEELGRLKTYPYVIHAEANAILKCARNGVSTQGATLYVTLSPCMECSKMILQAGIKKVIYLMPYRDDKGAEFLNRNGIDVAMLITYVHFLI